MSFLGTVTIVTVAAAVAVAGAAARASPPDAAVAAQFTRLSQRRIFFGHQSVGQNLLQGLTELAASSGSRPPLVRETTNPADVQPGTIAHALLGRNGDPAGKIAAFAEVMRSGMAESVDVAMMKLCFVDFEAGTDAPALFRRYQATMDDLTARYPHTTFVHVTVPLTAAQRGPKAWAKSLLGRTPGAVVENTRREQYNAMLRQAYSGKQPIFDLASLESRRPDGAVETVAWNGQQVPVLVADYTSDGGHLNDTGRQRLAREMLGAIVSAR